MLQYINSLPGETEGINTHMALSLALIWQVVLAVFLPLIEFHFHVYEAKFTLLALDLTEGWRVNEILHWS